VQDHRGIRSNEIGDWYRHRHALQGVRDLNAKPHRQYDVRNLVPYFVFSRDQALTKRYAKAIRKFVTNLPFEYEEQKEHPELVETLRKRMNLFIEQGDPKYWNSRPSADGQYAEFYNDPPSLHVPEIVAQQDEMVVLNKAIGLALWGQKTLENGAVDDQMTLTEAFLLAREMDTPDLFGVRASPDDLITTHRAGGVSAVAYALARHCETSHWTDEVAAWCSGVLHRAATIVEPESAIAYRGAIHFAHPCIFAVHGYAALLVRGYEVRAAQSALISLAVDAIDDVVKAVFVSSKQYAAAYPLFFRILLTLGLRQCVSARDDLPNYHSLHWDEGEAAQKTELIDWAESALDAAVVPALPQVPMPWIKDGTTRVRKGKAIDYVPNDVVFRFDLAERTLLEIDLATVLHTPSRSEFLAFVSNLVDWTIEEILPPFVDRRRDYTDSSPPFEWIYAFSAWCGKLCNRLSANEARSHILGRIYPLENDTSLVMMQSIMRLFMIYALIKSDTVSADSFSLWQEITDWVFENGRWKNSKDSDYLDREFQYCAMHVLFCAHNDVGPVLCAIDEGWSRLSMFEPIIKRAIRDVGQNQMLFYVFLTFLKRGGFDLLPDPALDWLVELANAKKSNQPFWEANGSETVALLRILLERRGQSLRPDHRAAVSRIADIMVDNGTRGAGFLQQELLRDV
jgi:hypothetical protein